MTRKDITLKLATDPPVLVLTEPLHPAEIKLLAYIRALGYGRLELKIQDGYPVLITRVEEMIKLV